jgi:hypothetical protein
LSRSLGHFVLGSLVRVADAKKVHLVLFANGSLGSDTRQNGQRRSNQLLNGP